ncbi:unnamed protein product [Rotaria sordida]|uniref:Uncharacterized protein n=1 Tax=Rotaria sordida TaxID=392033 RepID=A0A815EEZ0_9BILA|nr:unnamed protein product [Rotaria sordida]CAF1311618.1 unnamed protein product [Rotaria sordida]
MSTAGFQYTGDRDTARCKHCGLEAFNWTLYLNLPSSSTTTDQNTLISDEQENHPQPRKIDLKSRLNNLFEPDSLQQC